MTFDEYTIQFLNEGLSLTSARVRAANCVAADDWFARINARREAERVFKAKVRDERAQRRAERADIKAREKALRDAERAQRARVAAQLRNERIARIQAIAELPICNGVKQPKPTCGAGILWAMFDSIDEHEGITPSNSLLQGVEKGYNAGSVRTQYSRWKKFHGKE